MSQMLKESFSMAHMRGRKFSPGKHGISSKSSMGIGNRAHGCSKRHLSRSFSWHRASGGIILHESHSSTRNPFKTPLNFSNKGMHADSPSEAFPFIIPFHPGKGPEIDYPDSPVEPEDPDDDPGDEPDD